MEGPRVHATTSGIMPAVLLLQSKRNKTIASITLLIPALHLLIPLKGETKEHIGPDPKSVKASGSICVSCWKAA